MEEVKAETHEMPAWASRCFGQFRKDAVQLLQVVDITVKGMHSLLRVPGLVEIWHSLDRLPNINAASVDEENAECLREEEMRNAKETAELAKREIETGFQITYAHAIIGLWSYIEELIRNFAVELIRNDCNALNMKSISKIKVELADILRTSEDERPFLIVELLERDRAIGLCNGVEKFEALLEPFGLSGPVPKPLSKNIFEFGQVRNVIVHRGGVADRRFVTACPWLGMNVGDKIANTGKMYYEYNSLSVGYVALLLCRVANRYRSDVDIRWNTILEKYKE